MKDERRKSMIHYHTKKKKSKTAKPFERRVCGFTLKDEVAMMIYHFNADEEAQANNKLYELIGIYDDLVMRGELTPFYRCFITRDFRYV